MHKLRKWSLALGAAMTPAFLFAEGHTPESMLPDSFSDHLSDLKATATDLADKMTPIVLSIIGAFFVFFAIFYAVRMIRRAAKIG